MNVQDIIKNYLKDNHFDGLYNLDQECSCELDDLCPIVERPQSECKPGYEIRLDKNHKYYNAESNDNWGIG